MQTEDNMTVHNGFSSLSYMPVHGPDGTYYNQAVRLSESEFWHFSDALRAEAAMEMEFYRKLWLSEPMVRKENIAFMNLTQRDFLKRFVRTRRPMLDRNTYIIISKR